MFGIFEILGVFLAVGGIVALARGRGASPVVAGTVAVAGWVLIEFGGAFFIPRGESRFPLLLAAWAWIALGSRRRTFCSWGGPAKAGRKVELQPLPFPQQRQFGDLRSLRTAVAALLSVPVQVKYSS
jgi:hypothetical protein